METPLTSPSRTSHTRSTIARGAALLGAALIALLAPACRRHAALPPATDIAGTYALVSVDGSRVPA
ncbi:MAG: hypothetical protein JNL97_07650, partial [Verrucomicrobiales bacterium]|nr:hypothetical protein [Verrucomicrobiales bacterium]